MWTYFCLGLLVGWLLEWLIDWMFWRRHANVVVRGEPAQPPAGSTGDAR